MASALTLFLYIFAIIGIVLFVGIMYYWYLGYSKRSAQQAENNWPPPNYMRYIGSTCPTGWEFAGYNEQDNTVTCKNTLGLPTTGRTPNVCYDNVQDKTKSFSHLKQWPISKNAAPRLLSDRCEWIKGCGPNPEQYATWFGVEDLC